MTCQHNFCRRIQHPKCPKYSPESTKLLNGCHNLTANDGHNSIKPATYDSFQYTSPKRNNFSIMNFQLKIERSTVITGFHLWWNLFLELSAIDNAAWVGCFCWAMHSDPLTYKSFFILSQTNSRKNRPLYCNKSYIHHSLTYNIQFNKHTGVFVVFIWRTINLTRRLQDKYKTIYRDVRFTISLIAAHWTRWLAHWLDRWLNVCVTGPTNSLSL